MWLILGQAHNGRGLHVPPKGFLHSFLTGGAESAPCALDGLKEFSRKQVPLP
jgi:hypothetical protein